MKSNWLNTRGTKIITSQNDKLQDYILGNSARDLLYRRYCLLKLPLINLIDVKLLEGSVQKRNVYLFI